MKKIIFLLIFFVVFMSRVSMAQKITCADVTIEQGSTANLVFSIESDQASTLAEFFLTMPEGIAIKKENDDYVYERGSMLQSSHSVSVMDKFNGDVYVIIKNESGKNFKTTSGELITLPIVASSNMSDSTYQIKVTGVNITDLSPKQINTETEFDINVTVGNLVKTYTITFDTDGGSAIDPISQDYGTAVTAPAPPTKTGYTFLGWDKEIPTTMPASSIVIKALWKINQYTITFDTDGGTTVTPINQDYGTPITPPANPMKLGYTFVGWDKEIPTTMPAEDITIKALWKINENMIAFSLDGTSLTITCKIEGSEIYYGIGDGVEPTIRYQSPITLTDNRVVRAVAKKEGCGDSDISTFVVDLFKVSDIDVHITEDLMIEMTTTTPDATILYTIDGSDPLENGVVYPNMAINIDNDCTIKAIGKKSGYNNSSVTTFDLKWSSKTCPKPTFRLSGTKLYIESTIEDPVIYYTLNGETPTDKSLKYEYGVPIELVSNCTVKAILTKKGYRDSEVEVYVTSKFDVLSPEFSIDGTKLFITCGTEGSEIYYGIGEGADPTIRYQYPITLTDNRVIYAIAKKEGYNNSQVAEYTHSLITCEPATLDKYDGRNFTLKVQDGATAYYTVDGTEPTADSEKYTGLTALEGICTIKTLAVSPYKNPSKVTEIPITYFSDGESVVITEAGQLQQAMQWQGANEIKSLKVSGPLNATDLIYIKTEITSVEHLNLENTTIADNTLPDEAFAGMQSLVTFTAPKNINGIGERILANCPKLAAVVWNPAKKLPNSTFGDAKNPNMLVYVVTSTYAPDGVNVISNGLAKSIVLSDEDGNNNFYCPVPFKAERISYTHNYSMETGIEESKGWETLALPFTVQKITHILKGKQVELMSFKQFEDAGSPEEGHPFWLRTLTDNGFEDASTIEAYKPYIISMPNNKEYASRYNIVGNVTFFAENVDIGLTEALPASRYGTSLVPNFTKKTKSSKIWPLNIKEDYETYPMGSVFVPLLRDVKPFEAYATTEAMNARMMTISGLYNGVTDIDKILYDRSHEMKDEIVKVYTISGVLFKTGKRSDVMKQLPAGMYVVDGKKIVIE